MAAHPPLEPDVSVNLALAVVDSSTAPLLLLDGDFRVVAASKSFCAAFQIAPDKATGVLVFELGAGEWNMPRLRSLLDATAGGDAEIDAYEMDLKSKRQGPRRLVLNARKIDYGPAEDVRLLLTAIDVTDARIAEKLKDDLLREKAILLQEVQHRVANSLQIISSVILQSAKHAHSSEARHDLQAAHERVLSVAEVQRQLATSTLGDVGLKAYFSQLCQSLGASMIRDHKQLSIEVDADDSAVGADASVSLGLIVTELVINALKHAFPGRRQGKIIVAYHTRGPNWTLSVSDNGAGMPKDAASARPGLGTTIVEALAKQLRAAVTVTSAEPGTKVSVVHAQIAVVPDSSVEPSVAV
ncbi:MAG: signal transduction histidine kinase [Phenylobacterium sp.]|uniref:sensor histidine kinase n=1 Tax=Phenylobacterium sp. TaxID=1871053 RepID=UPI00261B21CE|nr:PAS domain-containing sensor histidine kinase [Phenylobacterium sp.]MDB5499804.1 signal transduction histidine kinase [Phenylobacterium sp.]